MNVGAPPVKAERKGEPDGDWRAVADDDDDEGLAGTAAGATIARLSDEDTRACPGPRWPTDSLSPGKGRWVRARAK
jgi:hypothetical protein